jgi:hypothetical protein
MSYNKEEQKQGNLRIFGNLNSEQLNAFDPIMDRSTKIWENKYLSMDMLEHVRRTYGRQSKQNYVLKAR